MMEIKELDCSWSVLDRSGWLLPCYGLFWIVLDRSAPFRVLQTTIIHLVSHLQPILAVCLPCLLFGKNEDCIRVIE